MLINNATGLLSLFSFKVGQKIIFNFLFQKKITQSLFVKAKLMSLQGHNLSIIPDTHKIFLTKNV